MRWHFDQFCFDPSDGRLTHASAGEPVTVRPQVGRLLEAFLQQPGTVLGRETLCRAIWDDSAVVDFESGLAALIRELRQAIERAGGNADLVETVPRRGYRLRTTQVRQGPNGVTTTRTRRRFPRWGQWLAALLALTIILVLWFWPGGLGHEALPEPGQPTLAIIPFDIVSAGVQLPESDRRMQLLMADRFLANLWQARLEGLVLIGRAALRPYEGRRDLAAAVAEDLGVDLLLEGSLMAVETDLWQVDVRLLSMPSGRVLWSSSAHWEQAPGVPSNDPAAQLVASLAAVWPELYRDLSARATDPLKGATRALVELP